MPYLLELSKLGHDISLLSFEKKDRFEAGQSRLRELCNQHNIDWFPETYTTKPPVLSTLKDVRKAQKSAVKILIEKQIQITHCRSYIAALIGLALKRKYQIPFLFDMRGFWADERIEGRIWNPSNPLFRIIYKYFKRKETQFFNESTHIISLTEAGKSIILKRDYKTVTAEKISVIPCCTDTTLFAPKIPEAVVNEYREKLNLAEFHPVISYLGSFGTWYMAAEMLDFFSLFLKTYPSALLLIITKEEADPIFQLARERDVSTDHLRIVPAEREEVPVLLSFSQANLFFIRPTFSKKASSPTKMGEALSMGIPIICNDGIGDCTAILQKAHAGLIVKDFSAPSYQRAIEGFAALLKRPPHQVRALAQEVFDLQRGVEKYHQAYLLAEKNRP